MKLASTVRSLLYCLALIFGFASIQSAHAGLSLQLDVIHNVAGGVYTLAPNLSLNTNISDSTPATYDEVFSPQTNSSGIANFTGGVGDNSSNTRDDFSDSNFAAFLQAVTNGPWKLVVNVGTTNEHTYTFTVSTSSLTSNLLVNAEIDYPRDGDTNVPPLPNFEWHGPTNTDSLFTYVLSFTNSTFQSANQAVTTTNTILPPALPDGDYTFVVDYTKDVSAFIASATPTDASHHAFAGWVSTGQFDTGNQSSFTVVIPSAPVISTGHTNIAEYQFEVGGRLGLDSSTNGNSVDGVTGWTLDPPPPFVLSTNAIAGSGAIQFSGYTALATTVNSSDPAFTNLSTTLAGSFSVSLWLNTTNTIGDDDDDLTSSSGQTILYASSFGPGASIGLTGGTLAFQTLDPDGNADTLHSTVTVTTGHYVHVVATRDQTTGEKKLYINGVLDNSDFASTEALAGNAFLSFGGLQQTPYTGLVDELQFYSGVLDGAEVSQLYANPGSVIPDTADTGSGLSIALNATNLSFTTSGDAEWFFETNVTFDGVSAAQSGSLLDSQSSVLQTTVVGPGLVTFYWQCLADDESFDLEFDINGNEMAVIDMFESDWFQESFSLPAGTNVLTWTAFTGVGSSTNDAGFVDLLSFSPGQAPIITLNPFDQTNYSGYSVALLAAATGVPAPTWQWYKNNVAVSGATNALYIPADSGSNSVAGNYYAVASNGAGSANTSTNTVTFVSAPLPPDWSIAFKSASHVPSDIAFSSYFFIELQDYYYNCVADSAGDLYIAAEFSNTNAFGTNILFPGTGGNAGAIVKQSSIGDPIWIQTITNNGNGHAQTLSVATAPGDGVYAVGNYSGTNWLGTNELTDSGVGSLFIARFAANGSNVWIRNLSSSILVSAQPNSLASDPSGNVTFIANFNGSNGNAELFQVDATGTFGWTQPISANTRNLTYSSGRLYASVYNSLGLTTTGNLTNSSDRRWTVAAFSDTNGQALWLRGVGAPLASGSTSGLFDDAPVITASGSNIFLVGRAYGSGATFGSFTVSWTNAAGDYVARYDTNGNAQLATAFGSATTTPIAAVADASGGFYVTGDFDTFAYFGQDLIAAPNNGSAFTGNPGQTFAAKFDANGNPLWARLAEAPPGLHESGYVNAFGIALVSDGVWVSSVFRPRVSFGDYVFNGNPLYFAANLIFDDYDSGALAKITDTVAPISPVSLINPQLLGATFQFSFVSTSGRTNSVQFTSDLSTHAWTTYTNVLGDGTQKTVVVPTSNPIQKYFRVMTQ